MIGTRHSQSCRSLDTFWETCSTPDQAQVHIQRTVLNARKKQAYRDMFEQIMNSPCQNHGFPVTHLTKDCVAYQQRIALGASKCTDQDGYWGDHYDRTAQFIQDQVRLSLFRTLTRTYFHLYKPSSPPSVMKDLGKSTS